MLDTIPDDDDCEIARHEVSEDGMTWRPFDREQDAKRMLHTRIVFAPPAQD